MIHYNNHGQVAPFLIVILVILLMATMVTVNIGKIGLTKTRTSNASDAGALAGGTLHTNTLNALADTNTAMIAEYAGQLAIFAIPKAIEQEPLMFATYVAFSAAQIAQFFLAWRTGIDGYKEAEKAARQLAFSNAGVDQAKPRDPGENYETWLKKDSPFQSWMESEGYVSGSYEWQDKQGGENAVKVDVDAPEFPGLAPLPGALISFYYKWIPVCTPCGYVPCCACGLCAAAVTLFNAYVAGANSRRISVGAGALPDIESPSYTTVPGICPCGGMVAWATVVYVVPIASIAAIVEDNPEITVTTTRVEPTRDLGFWQMRYSESSNPGAGISSSGRAKTSGGSVGPAPSGEYDSKLIPGGY